MCNQLTLLDCRVKEERSMDGKYQIMNAVYDCLVTSPEPQKFYFEVAERKWKKGVITIEGYSTTNDIHMRRHFQVMCDI